MQEVPSGLFLFGTTEEEFKLLMARRTVNFPGMEERMRKIFVIPPKPVELPTFWMDRFEVTNEDFREFVVAVGYRPENRSNYLEHWTSATEYPDWAGSFPVTWVSQMDAKAFCSWRGKRLPTEEEWEKAARGEAGGRFPWGDVRPTDETANFSTDALEPVGNRPSDCSPYGIYDLAGNASEFTASFTAGVRVSKVVVKGGCYKAGPSEMATFFRRSIQGVERRAEHIGFRCVAD
jgi:formylglycine-generating enzyme required for sulfatase activity